MPFVKKESTAGIQLLNGCVVDIFNDAIEQVVEVLKTSITSIEVVEGSDAVNT